MKSSTSSPLILASGSPRRRELIARLGVPFETISMDIPEPLDGSPPEEQARRLAALKLAAYTATYPDRDKSPVLCADTCVDLDGYILGKAADRQEAREMIRALSGNTHRVITGLAFKPPGLPPMLAAEITEVTFSSLLEEEIEWYIGTGEWKGVAGAYRIQEQGALLIEGLKGCYYNVMGLPLRLVYGMLRDTVPDLFTDRNFRSP
jgi:septum formation protein